MNLLMELLNLNRKKYQLCIYIELLEKFTSFKMDVSEDKPFSVLL